MSKYSEMLAAYCQDIKSGKIPANLYTKKAVSRFYKNLKREKDEDFLFFYDQSTADELCEFAECLKPSDLNGRTLPLLPWQVFVLSNLEGWRHKQDPGRKRFRTGYIEVPRKNAKTTNILEPLTLWNFLKYPAAESYLVSSRDDLAEKTYKEISYMIHADKTLDEILCPMSLAVTFKDKAESSRLGFFCDGAKDTDGFKPVFAAIDEFHAYANDKILTSMQYGMRSKKDAQLIVITTADVSTDNPCYELTNKSRRILNGIQEQEDFFCIIYTIDEGDDWRDPKNWIKANPSLGVIIDPTVIQSDIDDADVSPHKQPELKAKTFNIWGGGTVHTWMNIDKWQKNKDKTIDPERLKDVPCILGLDIAHTGDLCGYKRLFLIDGYEYYENAFYIPENTLLSRYKSENFNYLTWAENEIIQTTPGDTIDYDVIYNAILKDAERYKVKAIGYDPWQAKYIINKIEENRPDILLISIEQSLKKLSPIFKDYEKAILDGKVIDNSPLSLWAVMNTVTHPDEQDNYKPMKRSKASIHRIDPVVAATMAHGVAMFPEVKDILTQKAITFDRLKALL